jgi:hypothetical protein
MYAMVAAGGCVLLAAAVWLGVRRAQRTIAAARDKAAQSQRELVSVTDDFRELKSVFEIDLEMELELRETVGQGGFGEVRLAYYHTKDQLVAVKFLRAHLAQDEQSLSEFQREIRLLRTLRHANVITFHVRGGGVLCVCVWVGFLRTFLPPIYAMVGRGHEQWTTVSGD